MGGRGRGYAVDSEMMITHLTLCCCLPKAETNRGNKEISPHIILHPISSGAKKTKFTAGLLRTSHLEALKCDPEI